MNVGFAPKGSQLKWWRQSKVMGTLKPLFKNKLFALSDCTNAKSLRVSPLARAIMVGEEHAILTDAKKVL